jgi:hypothetical protein
MRRRSGRPTGGVRSTRRWRRGVVGAMLVAGTAFLVILPGSGAAAPTAANLQIGILVGQPPVTRQPPTIPNSGTATITGLKFVGGFVVTNLGPDPATVKVQIALPTGLHWGADAPDPGENCTVGETSVCDSALTAQGNSSLAAMGWDVVADSTGSYTLRVQILESSTADPDTSDNASTVTVVVTQPTSGSAALSASAVKVSPAKPKAGSRVVASVRVTRGGSPVKPTGIACAATVGKTKVKGSAKSSSGIASCLFKTPTSGKGKKMLGSVSFKAGGKSFTRRFSAGLR